MLNSIVFRKVYLALATFGVLCISPSANSQSLGCSSPPCSLNPVPCAHCTGAWSDGIATWTLASNNNPPSQGSYSVSGSVSAPHPGGPGCPVTTWTVSGTIIHTPGTPTVRAVTGITWNASNPSPNISCGTHSPAASFSITGTILNNGCNTGSGTFSRPGISTSVSLSKTADVPDMSPYEYVSAIAWWGISPTVMVFEQGLASTKSLAGRQVFEQPTSASTDTCWWVGSSFAYGGLSTGGWYVGAYYFNSQWHYDYVGMLHMGVDHYRSNGRIPCLVTIPQTMLIYSNDTSSSTPYVYNTLYWNLPDYVNVGVSRAGVQAWRTY